MSSFDEVFFQLQNLIDLHIPKMDFYYFALCHVCKKPGPDFKKCGACRVPHYCSREHQKQDWSKHKDICKAIVKTRKILSHKPGCSAEDFNHFKYSSGLLWASELRRPIQSYEHHMWMFPKVCSICYSPEAMIVCHECLSVAYCSEEHKEEHKESHEKCCRDLKISLLIYQKRLKSSSAEWKKCSIDPEVKCLLDNADKIMQLIGLNSEPDLSIKHVKYLITADDFCPAFNIIYALEKSGFVADRNAKKADIVIHIVGFDTMEDNLPWEVISEFLIHWIHNLKKVEFCFVGPNLHKRHSYNHWCSDCVHRGVVCMIARYKCLYHSVVSVVPKPDLVVGFNSGLHEFQGNGERDNWKESIPKLICHKEVPLLLTAYTEDEIKKDISRFDASLIKFYVEPRRNPYSNLRPMRNWEEGAESSYYENGYIAVLTKK